MARVLQHRGPDHSGLFVEPGIAIGNNRLAIIDTAGGDQPMYGAAGNLVIVYNGEVYNHIEIRRELEALGHRFHSLCDTETVLRAFEEFGPKCVERLNGMFAFAIWDRNRRRLLLARDRLGIKPLYLCKLEDGWAFASEAKALLPLVPGGVRPDWTAINRYFTFGYVPSPQSPFAGTEKLPPGHYAWVDTTGAAPKLEATRYWSPVFGRGEPVSETEAMARLDELIADAVNRELMSDVPLGVFLSGGLDSSAVAFHAAQRKDHGIKSFALAFEEETHDESVNARLVADHLRLDHHELRMTPELARDGLKRVAGIMDEPFGDSTVLPLFLLSEYARRHVKVALTGWGGDEIFAGYPTLKAHRAARYYRGLPGPLFQKAIPVVVSRLPVSDRYLSFEFKAKRFVRGMDMTPEQQHFLWMGYFDDAAKRRLFKPSVLEQIEGSTFAQVDRLASEIAEDDLVSRIMHLDAAYFLEGNGLFQADRMSMAASLETRVPLLNNELLDYVLPLPVRLKMAGGEPKGLLKKVLANRLPKSILVRPKKGFAPPSSIWARGVFRSLIEQQLNEETIRDQGVFEYAEIRKIIDEHHSRRADHGRNIWALFSFQVWYDRVVCN